MDDASYDLVEKIQCQRNISSLTRMPFKVHTIIYIHTVRTYTFEETNKQKH